MNPAALAPEGPCLDKNAGDTACPFPYIGPEALRPPIVAALMQVVDPEVALSIVDVGLVYGVEVGSDSLHVRLTMTSAACPVADVIIEEAEAALDRATPPHLHINIELVWEPPWNTDRMSKRAKLFMQW